MPTRCPFSSVAAAPLSRREAHFVVLGARGQPGSPTPATTDHGSPIIDDRGSWRSRSAGGERWLARRMTPANSGLLRARPRRRTRPRCGTGPDCWQDVNHSSHSSKAVQGAEILVHARLRKSELIHEPCVVKDSGVTVHVIRRTKLTIGGAGRATGDAVKIALPGPAHSVAGGDVDG